MTNEALQWGHLRLHVMTVSHLNCSSLGREQQQGYSVLVSCLLSVKFIMNAKKKLPHYRSQN